MDIHFPRVLRLAYVPFGAGLSARAHDNKNCARSNKNISARSTTKEARAQTTKKTNARWNKTKTRLDHTYTHIFGVAKRMFWRFRGVDHQEDAWRQS